MTSAIHVFSIEAEHTTARYFERAISLIHGTAPICSGSSPDLGGVSSTDVFCYIDPASTFPLGLETAPCLTVAYLIDVHQDLPSRLQLSKFFDVVFIAQKDFVSAFQGIGHNHAHWLPLACDPDVHCMPAADRSYDVGFVGKLGQWGTRRHEILTRVLPRYRSNDYRQFYAPRDMARIYGQSKIVFNASINGDLNMRCFEALASGALLVTDRVGNGLNDLLEEDVHYVGYSNVDEALRKIDHYLAHPVERERIAAEGLRAALRSHTYRHRTEEMFQKAKGAFGGAPARKFNHATLGKLYSEIFVSLRKPSHIARVARQYGLTSAMAGYFIESFGRWVNARIPVTPNAIRARLRANMEKR